MTEFLTWYALLFLFGAAAWPLLFALLPGLPDRGYTLSRAAGLMGVGYIFWLLSSVGLLPNSTGAMLLALLILVAVALWAFFTTGDRPSPAEWLREHGGMVLTAEVLFFVAFAAWALVRAGNPELTGTEKPMELAFLNGIRTSDAFPPRDPWLSGYAISYYYFGYVIVAMLADLANTVSGVAFNLAVAMLFALTAVGAYGVVYNLLVSERFSRAQAQVGALLAPIFTVLVGNLAAFLDLVRVRFPAALPAGFWAWLDIEQMNAPVSDFSGALHEVRFLWWWRSSRVIHDRLPNGESLGLQPIDEFPFFSFLLADMHPHVLALPFVLLALGLAFNALCQPERLSAPQFGLYVIAFGGLAFLNAWDLPIYLFVLVAALAVRGIRQRGGLDLAGVLVPAATGLAIAVLGLLAYLPWVLSFSSQAGGVLPNALFPTRFQQILVMFGVFLPLVLWFLIAALREKRGRPDLLNAVLLPVALLVTLTGVMLLMGYIAMSVDPAVRGFLYGAFAYPPEAVANAPLELLPTAFADVLGYRLSRPVTPIALTALIALGVALLFPPVEDVRLSQHSEGQPVMFVGVLFVTALLLVLGPEFLYLRDNFAHRLNTIFKFYYAAWVLFAVGAAYAAVWLIGTRRGVGRAAAVTLIAALVTAGMIYPRHALPSRGVDLARGPDEAPLTLDGLAFIARGNPPEAAALTWIAENTAPDAVILEAVGGAYSEHGRVSAVTGRPTVMGWANHQRQWRGELYPTLAGSRETDVQIIYDTLSIQEAIRLLRQYDVDYIYVGQRERNPEFASPGGVAKFERYFTPVFENSGVTIYRVDPLEEAN